MDEIKKKTTDFSSYTIDEATKKEFLDQLQKMKHFTESMKQNVRYGIT